MNTSFYPAGPLRGRLVVPADKSISHRAAIVAAMASQPVRVRNFLNATDTRSTLTAIRRLGVRVDARDGELLIHGRGLRGPRVTLSPINVGNAGTLMRLLPGWLASQADRSFQLDGDDSIRRRPVDRIARPLELMGARVDARGGRYPPFTVLGAPLLGTVYELPEPSAQVKSCVLLAGLATDETTVIEPVPSRDHTERLLLAAGATLRRDIDGSGHRTTVRATDQLGLETIEIPGDLSSAAFMLAGAALVPGSELVLEGVGVNWTRTGFLRIITRMGASVAGEAEEPGTFATVEPVANLEVRHARLTATTVQSDEVPLAIDELPLVALLGCFADGETTVRGAAELRVKESDRIAMTVQGLRRLGAHIEATEDGFTVRGIGRLRGGRMNAHGDHRLAMLGAVAGVASEQGVEVVGMDAAAVSYPTFCRDLARLQV